MPLETFWVFVGLRVRGFQLRRFLPAFVIPFAIACRPAQGTKGEIGSGRSDDSITVQTPCAERVIVRNHGRADRTLRLVVSAHKPSRIAIRGYAPESGDRFSSRIFALPEGGTAGKVVEGEQSHTFDSRGRPHCARTLSDSVPDGVPPEYGRAHSLFPRNTKAAYYPGVVAVTWQPPIDTVAVNALLRSLKVSVLCRSRDVPISNCLWIDGDDAKARLAIRLADQLQKSPLVMAAGPLLQEY
jgi:hypothetical protein